MLRDKLAAGSFGWFLILFFVKKNYADIVLCQNISIETSYQMNHALSSPMQNLIKLDFEYCLGIDILYTSTLALREIGSQGRRLAGGLVHTLHPLGKKELYPTALQAKRDVAVGIDFRSLCCRA